LEHRSAGIINSMTAPSHHDGGFHEEARQDKSFEGSPEEKKCQKKLEEI
jgi:hypothetical protein